MGASVNASDVEKNFGAWHDETLQITKYGRETVYHLGRHFPRTLAVLSAGQVDRRPNRRREGSDTRR